jgi:ankyrin repeat protein
MSANTTYEDMPVLMSAAMLCTREPAAGRVDIVKALLAAHAKVDITDENGSTPLLWSVNVGCPTDIVRALIAAGANVNAKAKGGATPLMLAQALNRSEIIAVLKAAGAKP